MKKILLSISTVLAVSALNAQSTYVYTDVNPDVVLTAAATPEQFDIDFDNDGNIDVSIGAAQITFQGMPLNISLAVAASNSADNAFAGAVDGNGLATTTPLALNTPIGSDEALFPVGTTWIDTVEAGGTGYYNSIYSAALGNIAGTWNNGTDAYIGARFIKNSANYYGWILVNVNADASTTTVKGFAYNSTAESQILAGATSNLSVAEIAQNAWGVFTSGKTVHVTANSEGTISVMNAAGVVVGTATSTNGVTAIALDNASAGMYFVALEQNGVTTTKKVVLN